MSYPLAAAALLTVGIGLAHSILGERYILTRVFRLDSFPELFGSDWFTKRTMRFAWHLTTVAWFGLALILLIIGNEVAADTSAELTADNGSLARSIGQVIAVLFGVSAVIAAAASHFRHFAWPIFTAIAVLTWVGV